MSEKSSFLNVEVDYSVRVYELNAAAKDFKAWFEIVFKPTNKAHEAYMFDEIDGMLEVMCHNQSGMNIDSLESMFCAYLSSIIPIDNERNNSKLQ